jgi:hypothetical protein
MYRKRLLLLLPLVFISFVNSSAVNWQFRGPTTYYTRDDDLKITSAGAIQDVAAGADNTWFVGSVNGGIWRTKNLQNKVPHWENVLDKQPGITCSSIAALHVSKTDGKRIYAGCGGSTSSEQGSDWNVLNSGEWSGIMHSNDGGETWSMISGFPMNYYITSIYEVESEVILVASQSNLFNRNDGGIWRFNINTGELQKVSDIPTFTLTALSKSSTSSIVATHARNSENSVSVTTDGGKSFEDYGKLQWAEGTYPFYTCAAMMMNGDLIVAGLNTKTANVSATSSQFFVKRKGATNWTELPGQPTSMDEDGMPKDRMAILADPMVPDLMYVAGNAGALAWRVNTTVGEWEKMWDKPDVPDGSLPHGDCRNYAWDEETNRLVLTSDGGVFVRENPRERGGKWYSLNGDYQSMELLSAHYDPREDRFVMGAQDNCAQVTKPNAKPSDVAIGFVEGDGTVTLVDNVHNPARLFGTTQFLGVGTIDIDPTTTTTATDDDDDSCGGLCFVQGDKFINVPIDVYFPEPSSFPYFVSPYALNTQNPSELFFWANGTSTRQSAFYKFTIPDDAQSKKDIPEPTLVIATPEDSFFLEFVTGGFTAGKPDEELLIGMSNTDLYVKNANTDGKMIKRRLPTTFAIPVTLPYDKTDKGARILGPVTHGRTVSMAVSPSDSNVIAITGWPSVAENSVKEEVWVTTDGGKTWNEVTNNLRQACGVVGIVRPGGLLIVDLLRNKARALLISTSNGVMVAYLPLTFASIEGDVEWQRFGSTDEFPIVLTSALSYEHYSDTLVAATFGRGIYSLSNAKEALLDVLYSKPNLNHGNSNKRVKEESSSKYFPLQK